MRRLSNGTAKAVTSSTQIFRVLSNRAVYSRSYWGATEFKAILDNTLHRACTRLGCDNEESSARRFAIMLVETLISKLRGFTHGAAAVSGRLFHRFARSTPLRTRANQFLAGRTGGVGCHTPTPASDYGSQGA